jgi:hypothetical protein
MPAVSGADRRFSAHFSQGRKRRSQLALLLRKWSEKNLGSLTAIAIALLAGGIVMWAIDAWSNRVDANTTHVEEITLAQAIWIGLCQTLSAVFPGTSRSMSTIASGQVAGLDRPTALEFSFLPPRDGICSKRFTRAKPPELRALRRRMWS